MTTSSIPRQRWLWIAVALAAVASVLALAGLREEVAAAGPTAHASKAANVDIDHFAFTPSTLRVAKGSKVVFSNSSRVKHTATRAGSFDTGKIKPGSSVSITFSHAGTFAYHCTIHTFMHGKIVVE